MFSSLVGYNFLTPYEPRALLLTGRENQTVGKTQRYGSGHGGRRNTTSHPEAPKPKSQKPAAWTGSVSFLFVVNELQVDYEPLPGEGHPLTDQWLNPMPPQNPAAYTGELIGTVFRYQNGVVNPAQGYLWYDNRGINLAKD
jgi:hypothetical protein